MKRAINNLGALVFLTMVVGVVAPLGMHLGVSSSAVGGSDKATHNSKAASVVFNGGAVAGPASKPGALSLTPLYVTFDAHSSFGQEGYRKIINTFLDRLSASSGSKNDPLMPVTSFHDAQGQRLSDSISITPPRVISLPLPVGLPGCTPDQGPAYGDGAGFSSCITDDQIQGSVETYLEATSSPQDLAHSYVVFLPRGLEQCNTTKNMSQGGDCNITLAGFCAEHFGVSFTNSNSTLLVMTVPWPTFSKDVTCLPGNVSSQGFSGQRIAYSTVPSLIHEIAETETDPLGNGWVSIKGTEVGDACDSASVALDQDLFGNSWDLTLGGEHYLTQYLLERTSRTCKI
jgi:hypothetical protein